MKRAVVLAALLLVVGVSLSAIPAEKPRAALATGGLYIWLADPGTATCIGGTPTGSFPPCSPGTRRILWRHFVGTFAFGNVTGPGAQYLPVMPAQFLAPGSCNLDGRYRGHCWGTFEGPGTGSGTWEGAWSGWIDFVAFGGDLSLVGHGSGSVEMDGAQLKIDSASPGTGNPYDPMPFTARILKGGS